MAEILSSSLAHSLSGKYALFRVDARIKFQPHEMNSHWFLRMAFIEDDRFVDDKLGSYARTFVADASPKNVSFDIRLRKTKVDTEWGDEEVFCHLDVVPLEAPEPFRMDEATTNKVTVDV